MASGLRLVCTPPRIGGESPSHSFSPRPHASPSKNTSNTGLASSSENAKPPQASSSSTATFNVPETQKERQQALDRGPLLKFRLRERSNYLKRRNSQSQHDLIFKKKRKFKNDPLPPSASNIILPTRFLLGGNIADPLNLASFAGESSPQVTPISSPLPTPKYKKEVEVVIPANIHDPLNLNNASDDGDETNGSSPVKRKNRKRKRKRTESEKSIEESPEEAQQLDSTGDKTSEVNDADTASTSTTTATPTTSLSQNMTLHLTDIMKRHEREEIVSPVLPQDPPPVTYQRFDRGFNRRNNNQFGNRQRFFRNDPLFIFFDDQQQDLKKKGNRRKKKKNRIPDQTKQPEESNESTERNTTSSDPPATKKYRAKGQEFRYGNYSRYYGYRGNWSSKIFEDPRLTCFKREWFEGKHVLDIGCNSGEVTISVAHLFNPEVITGIDIDGKLINMARNNIRHRTDALKKLPTSVSDGPTTPASSSLHLSSNSSSSEVKSSLNQTGSGDAKSQALGSSHLFPNNVKFIEGNYLLDSDSLLDTVSPEYDTILCLSITKWIHLNWGDEGLKRFFKKMFLNLRPGGKLVLEPQAWPSYVKKHSWTEDTDRNYKAIQMKPDKFSEYLLSPEVGFASCQLIGTPMHQSKGFRRPIYLLTKRTTPMITTETSNERVTSTDSTSNPTNKSNETKTTSSSSTTSEEITNENLLKQQQREHNLL